MFIREVKLYSLVASSEEADTLQTIIEAIDDFKTRIELDDSEYGYAKIYDNLEAAIIALEDVADHIEIETKNEDREDIEENDDFKDISI